jgi:hypothetical protein
MESSKSLTVKFNSISSKSTICFDEEFIVEGLFEFEEE